MIGVFDSGIGGLTVLKALAEHFPQENFLYLGDTARLPYGTKSPETIRKYSEQVMNYLADQQVKALVIACNTASSQVIETHWQKLPVYTVIEPGAQKALRETKNGRIGVLGTRTTIQSAAYPLSLEKTATAEGRTVETFSQACPLFVPLAEEGLVDDPITNLIAFRYLQPVLQQGVDTLILGCTHYPLLKKSLQRVCGNQVTLVDSGTALCERLEKDFQNGVLKKEVGAEAERKIKALSTDLSPHMKSWALEILNPLQIHEFHSIDLV
jgi:glutamate racemase